MRRRRIVFSRLVTRHTTEPNSLRSGHSNMTRSVGSTFFYDNPGPPSTGRLFAVLVAISIATGVAVVATCLVVAPRAPAVAASP